MSSLGLLFQKQNLAEPDKSSADQPKGLSLLQRLRQSEKEKQQNTSKGTPYLGDLANWKVSGKAKQGSKNDSEMECQSKDQKDDAPSTFKEALDSFGKIKNDSEISFKMNNTNIPELCNMITSFQTEIINSNVANNEVVEFKCLLDKLNALCNKNKNTMNSVHSVHSEDKFDSRKIGTPSFKSSINK